MAVGKAPDAPPVLQSAQRAGDDTPDAAELAGRGEIVLCNGKGLVDQATEDHILRAHVFPFERIRVFAGTGKLPILFQKLRMVNVKVVVDIVKTRRARNLIHRMIGPAAHIRDESAALQFLAQERLGPRHKFNLHILQEERKGRMLAIAHPHRLRQAVVNIRVGGRLAFFLLC